MIDDDNILPEDFFERSRDEYREIQTACKNDILFAPTVMRRGERVQSQ